MSLCVGMGGGCVKKKHSLYIILNENFSIRFFNYEK